MKHDLRSISKSAASLLVGIARGEGNFPALDSPAIDFFRMGRLSCTRPPGGGIGPAPAAAHRQARPPAADRRTVERKAGRARRLGRPVDQAAPQRRRHLFLRYQWWLGRSFRNGSEITWAAGFGYGGQRLFVVPALYLVVMVSAGHYGGPLQSVIPSGIFTKVVLQTVKD